MTERGRANLRAAAVALAVLGGAALAVVAAELPQGLVAFGDPWLVEGRLGLGPSPPDPDALSVASTRGELRRPLFWLALDLLREHAADPVRAAHLAARVLHVLTAAGLALAAAALARRAGRASGPATLAAALAAAAWMLHPAHVAAISSVASLGVLLGSFLLSLAAWLWMLAPERVAPRVAGAMLVVAAAAAEPALGAGAAALIVADEWLFGRGVPRARGARATGLVAAIVAAALLLASTSVREYDSGARVVPWATSLVRPLRELLWPLGLVPTGSAPDVAEPGRVVDVATACVLLAAALFGYRRRAGWGAMLVATLVLAAATAALARPYSGADASAYAASLPLAAGLAVVAAGLGARARLVAAGAGLAATASLAVLAHRQAAVWRDPESLAAYATSLDPGHERAHVALLDRARRRGAPAAELLQRARRAAGEGLFGRPLAHARLGSLLLESGATAEARRHLEAAASDAPWIAAARFDLGALDLREGRADYPLHLRVATRLDDESGHGWALFADSLDRHGDAEGARAAIERAAALAPQDAEIVSRARRAR